MSLWGHLRQRNSHQQMLMRLTSRHPGSEVVHPSPNERYLALLLQDEDGRQAEVWLDVDRLLEARRLDLPEIPWRDIHLSYLARWLGNLDLRFIYEDEVWATAQISPCVQPLPKMALSLPAKPVPLLCIKWPESERSGLRGIIQKQIPFRMKFVLGYSRLILGQLIEVAPGDLLLIKREFMHLAVGQWGLYRLRYDMEQEVSIVEEHLAEHDNMYREEDPPLHDWANLPVEIEFVLDWRTVSLAELEAIGPGSALALNPDAEKNIKIYLNKTLFARGELVVLETSGLAVEINHVNPGLIARMDAADAE